MSTRTRTRAGRAFVASALVAAVVGAPMAAMAAEDAPTAPRPVPKTNEYAVGQSVQIRMNAAGEQNSPLANFRWSVTQVTVQGEADETVKVPVPEDGEMLHSLQNLGSIPQEDGVAIYDVDVSDGVGNARSVSLVPQDMELPVGLTTRFTLDGKEISPQDLVGKSGVVTATYTVKNLSTQRVEVPITSVTGETVTKTVDAQVPMVVEASTLLPMRYGGLNTGSGIGGADGRGNNQVKWIGLPFTPLSKTGETTFGWAANVTDAVIPSMLIQVLPVYMEAQDDTADTPEEKAAKAQKAALNLKGLFPGVTPPNISDGAAAAKAGVQQLLEGLAGFKADAEAKGDPLVTLETGLNTFFQNFGADLEAVSAAVDAENPDGVAAKLTALQAAKLDKVVAALNELETALPGLSEKVSGLATSIGAAGEQLVATGNKLEAAQPTLEQVGELIPQVAALLPVINEDLVKANALVGQLSPLWPTIDGVVQKANAALPQVNELIASGSFPLICPGDPAGTTGLTVAQLNTLLADLHNELPDVFPALPALPGGSGPAARVACNTVRATINAKLRGVAQNPELTAKLSEVQTLVATAAESAVFAPDNADAVQAALGKVTDAIAKIQPIVDKLATNPTIKEKPEQTGKDLIALASAITELNGPLQELGTAVEGAQAPLTKASAAITAIGGGLKPLETALSTSIPGLVTSMDALSTKLKTIGVGLESSNVDLPALDAVIGQIVAGVLASPNGVQVTSGLDTLGGGVGQIKAELGRFAGDLIVSLKAGGEEIVKDVKVVKEVAGKKVTEVKKVATAAGEKVDNTKATMAGLVTVASESPLPYGGDPANAPEGTVLAGAYEFRLDAADSNGPQTPWRIALGILIALGAGFLGVYLTKRNQPA